MAKTGYTTYWVPLAGADMAALKAQHNRTFPNNQLAIVKDKILGDMVKVAIMQGETLPKDAVTKIPVSNANEPL